MWIQSCCESLLACEKGSAACCTSIDRMWSTRNPGFTSSKCCRLRSSSPAPISATSAIAISETTRMSCVLRGPDPAVPLLPCLRSEEHTSELQSRFDLVCRLLLEIKILLFEVNKLTNNQNI